MFMNGFLYLHGVPSTVNPALAVVFQLPQLFNHSVETAHVIRKLVDAAMRRLREPGGALDGQIQVCSGSCRLHGNTVNCSPVSSTVTRCWRCAACGRSPSVCCTTFDGFWSQWGTRLAAGMSLLWRRARCVRQSTSAASTTADSDRAEPFVELCFVNHLVEVVVLGTLSQIEATMSSGIQQLSGSLRVSATTNTAQGPPAFLEPCLATLASCSSNRMTRWHHSSCDSWDGMEPVVFAAVTAWSVR